MLESRFLFADYAVVYISYGSLGSSCNGFLLEEPFLCSCPLPAYSPPGVMKMMG